MSDIGKLLDADADQRKMHLISVNAEDLFFKGHITAEEYAMICKGEQVSMSIHTIDKTPEDEPDCVREAAEKVAKSLEQSTISNTTVSYLVSVIKKAEEIIDAAIEEWIPNQIDNTLIRTKRCDIALKDDPLTLKFEVRFMLLNIEKETNQTIGTTIGVDTGLLVGDEIKDKPFWDKFRHAVRNQFTTITIQLIKAIKIGIFGVNY